MTFSIEACVNYPDDECDTPQSTSMSRQQVHAWIDKLLDTETDLQSCVITLCKERAK